MGNDPGRQLELREDPMTNANGTTWGTTWGVSWS